MTKKLLDALAYAYNVECNASIIQNIFSVFVGFEM